jgi:hypothetical protein
MSKNSASERLRALAEKEVPRSKTARVRQVFDDIEALQRDGYSLTQILDSLNEEGFDLSLSQFKVMLHRIRKERGTTREALKAAQQATGTARPEQQQAAPKAAATQPEQPAAPAGVPKPATKPPPTFTREHGPGAKVNLDD